MSKRTSFWLAIVIILMAALVRLWNLSALPPGLNLLEAQDARIAELVRIGRVEVLYDTGTEGREGLYHILLSAVTTFVGNDPFGYRLLSVWVMLLSLSLLYTLTRRLYGRSTGLIAVAAMSVPFWSVLLSRSIARETLLPLIVTATLMALARTLPVYRRPSLAPTTLPFALLGLVLGFGFYVHPAHYVVVLLAMAFIAYMIITRQRMSRRTLSYLSFTIVILVIIVTPYLISSLRLQELNGATRLSGEYNMIADTGIGETILGGLGGVFVSGDQSILHNVPGRPYIDAVSGLLILIGIVSAGQRFMQPRYGLMVLAAVLLFPVAIFAPGSPNFMAYSTIIPLLSIFFALGVKQLTRYISRQRFTTYIGYGVTLLLLANFAWTVFSLHGVWGASADVRAAYHERIFRLATYLDETVTDTSTVVCVSDLPFGLPVWNSDVDKVATLLVLMMDNPDERNIRYVDCGSGLVLANGGAHQQVIFPEPDMLERLHPYITDWVDDGDLIVEGVPENSVVSMIVEDRLSDTIGLFTTTAPAGFAPESPGGVAPALLPVQFEEKLAFLGDDTAETDLTAGAIATIVTYWRVDDLLPHDLIFFTHLLFDAETRVAQTDTISVVPDRLQSRDVLVQLTFVPLPETLPEGTYETSTGVYLQNDSTRLDVLDNGTPRGTRLFINEIVVQ